jgi:hypothetical protein
MISRSALFSLGYDPRMCYKLHFHSSAGNAKMHKLLIITAALLGSALLAIPATVSAQEIFRWVDNDGILHFSDRAPEGMEATLMRIKPNTVQLVQPEKRFTSETGAGGVGENSEAPELSYAEQRRQARAKNRKDSREKAQETAAGCEIMRRQKAFVEPSPRVIVQNDDGTMRRLDDGERERMLREANRYLATNCN